MSTKSEKSNNSQKYVIAAALSITAIIGYVSYKRYPISSNERISRKKAIKISKDQTCLTLELRSNKDTIDYKSKLTEKELSHIKTRRDKSKFLVYCTNCHEPGHSQSRCDKRYKICVVGDSHTSFWRSAARYYLNTEVIRIQISGMSAQGLMNRNSHLKTIHIFFNI